MTFIPTSASSTQGGNLISDKMNRTDYHWYLVRTRPHQEQKCYDCIRQGIERGVKNVLEAYCPRHTTVKCEGKNEGLPLFGGLVFVLATHQALSDFLQSAYPEGKILFDRKGRQTGKATPWVLPERQMAAFREFNENFAEHLVVLERPYSDYAFNPKTNEPNEIVRVVDGPLAGREGYLVRVRGDRRLVFQMSEPFGKDELMTAAIPHLWNFHVVRIHQSLHDRLSKATLKARAVDFLWGEMQGCDYDNAKCAATLQRIFEQLVAKPSLGSLCQAILYSHRSLSKRLMRLTAAEAEGLLYVTRYLKVDPDFITSNYSTLTVRPFLTPTSGIVIPEGQSAAFFSHDSLVECSLRQTFQEEWYDVDAHASQWKSVTYYAHLGVLSDPAGNGCFVFANWHEFLTHYYRTDAVAHDRLVNGQSVKDAKNRKGGEDNRERLLESFRNFAPKLHQVLTDEHFPVKPIEELPVAGQSLNVLAIQLPQSSWQPDETPFEHTDLQEALNLLATTCLQICREINTTTHLAIWRRYLSTVWLHD